MNPVEIVEFVVEALRSRKAQDILVLDISGLTVIADYFVIATGSSPINVHALMDAVQDASRIHGIKGTRPEGMDTANWVLVDLGDVIVHIFDEEHRDFYQLERLWADAPRLPLPEETA